MNVGKNINYLREANELTQKELAEKVYTSQQMINRIENCISDPSLKLAQRIAEVFGLTIDELVYGKSAQENQNQLA